MVAMIFLLAPILTTIYLSLGGGTFLEFPIHQLSADLYVRFFQSSDWRDPFARSIIVAFEAGAIASMVTFPAAYALQFARPSLERFGLILLILPMTLPTIVLAVGQIFLFSRLHLIDTISGIALSHAAVTVPPAFLLLYAVMVDRGIPEEEIAASLGAGRLYRVATIVIPLLLVAILGSFLVAFLTSFDESVLSLFVGGPVTETLPRKIFDGIRYDLDPVTTVAASLSFLTWLSVTSLWVLWWGAGRGKQR